LHPQLAELNRQLDELSDRAGALVTSMLPDDLRLSIDPDCWSVAECLEHLNLFSETYLLLIRDANRQARAEQLFGAGTFRLDIMGRVLNWVMQPPARIKVRTTERFQPVLIGQPEDLLQRFTSLQAQLKTEIAGVEDLDLSRVKVRSPILKRAKYNLFSCFVLLVTHQQRHLWQAENAKIAIVRDRY
jgi:hypothetical protein